MSDGGIAVVLWIEEGVVREAHGNIRSDFWFVPAQISPNSGRVAFGTPDVALDQATGEILAVWASRTGTTCCTVEAASTQAAGAAGKRSTSARCGLQPTCLVWRSGTTPAWRCGSTRSASSPPSEPRGSQGLVQTYARVRSDRNRGRTRGVRRFPRKRRGGMDRQRHPSRGTPASSLRSMAGSRRRLDRRLGGRAGRDGRRRARRGCLEQADLSAGRGHGRQPRQPRSCPRRAVGTEDRRRDRNGCSVLDPADAVRRRWRESRSGSSETGAALGEPTCRTSTDEQARMSSRSPSRMSAATCRPQRRQSDRRPARSVRRPSITGSRKVGALLTCRRGTWAGSPPMSFKYRWRRNGEPIARATGRTHRIIPRDAGSRITCVVIAANPAGSVRAISGPVLVES